MTAVADAGARGAEDRTGRGWPHPRLVTYLAGEAPSRYRRRPGRAGAAAEIIVRGSLHGLGIGLVIGAALGAALGAGGAVSGTRLGLSLALPLLGALVGSLLGAAVGLPAAAVLAVVLSAVPDGQPEVVRRRTATTLALLLEALVTWLAIWTLLSDTGEDLRNRVLVVFPTLAVGVALTARLLRRSTRSLADTWNDRTGRQPVRP